MSSKAAKTSEKNHVLYEYLSWPYEFFFKPFFVIGMKKVMRRIQDLKAKRVLEVGTGTGYSLEHYPQGLEIVGADLSDKMVGISQKRAKELKGQKICICNVADLSKVAEPESFDVVTSFSVITVVPDPQKFLDELVSYCKPGGHIFIVMHSRLEDKFKLTDRVMNWPAKKLFGFTLLRHIKDYNLDKLELVSVEPINSFLSYPYNHLVTLKKK